MQANSNQLELNIVIIRDRNYSGKKLLTKVVLPLVASYGVLQLEPTFSHCTRRNLVNEDYS